MSTPSSSTGRSVGPQVETTSGTVRGTSGPGGTRIFKGVPYAEAPVGNLRFRAPRPAPRWTGVRSAVHDAPVAPQRVSNPFTGAGPDTEQSEDCLTLTVTTPPTTTDDAPRPVLVWFHGGDNVTGSGSAPAYAGDALALRGDVVVVTVSYRLGALGWVDFSSFSTSQHIFETNLGLRDQIAALEWVRDNISAFGGDPGAVTVGGQSAGATSVTTLLCVPSAAGLFHRAIAMSPDVAGVSGAERAAGWARDYVNWLRTTESLAVDALLTAPPKELADATARLAALVAKETPGASCTRPVVDGDLLPEHPVDVLTEGRGHPVPLLAGSTKHEGLPFVGSRRSAVPTTSEAIDLFFEINDPGAQLTVLSAYPGYPSMRARAQLGGDAMFWVPTVTAARAHAEQAPTFVYRYDVTTPALNLRGHGGGHGTELVPTFGTLSSSRARALTRLGGLEDLTAVSERMQDAWTSFVRTGTPGTGWPTYDSDDRLTKVFASRDRVVSDPGRERRRAWEGVARYR
ncbi:carboxylesterase/lipase family protein [Sanguibacter suaedae]|uniref:carboxylesterase/lipase family protein n=1 Tax=Sanguibacter suaedae TaxID=2795737 RepID=UPI0027DE5FF9|nr:carboxylesterase/lipase family protein [Sanguibacter suaedae]